MSSLILLSLLFPLLIAATVSNVSDEVISREEKEWRMEAVQKLWSERSRMGRTTLHRIEGAQIPGLPMMDLFVKNETASASGTLKHRFVWALTLWAVTEGMIKSNTSVYDSTSGNTGSSEAYMCQLIGVNYTAVVAKDLEQEKINQITRYNGSIMKVEVEKRNIVAEEMAKNNSGFFMNQFGNADAAEEYHESGGYPKESTNVFHEISQQMNETFNMSDPNYFIHSAGTGGTISSVGKYISRYSLKTKVVLADSQYSLFYDYVLSNKYTNLSAGDPGRPKWVKPGVAGIGYGYNIAPILFKNSTSLLRTVIDEVVRMPDMATIAAMRSLRSINIDAGASTALNFLVALYKGIVHAEGQDKISAKERVSMVFIMGDPGRYYTSTYYNDTYVENLSDLGGMKALNCWKKRIDDAMANGTNFMKNATACM